MVFHFNIIVFVRVHQTVRVPCIYTQSRGHKISCTGNQAHIKPIESVSFFRGTATRYRNLLLPWGEIHHISPGYITISAHELVFIRNDITKLWPHLHEQPVCKGILTHYRQVEVVPICSNTFTDYIVPIIIEVTLCRIQQLRLYRKPFMDTNIYQTTYMKTSYILRINR